MSLERAIEYIDMDEYVEATPKSLRLRNAFWTRPHANEPLHSPRCINRDT